ncbi:MAG TPA: hemerythrin domain-containing protein [Cyclobacteriaceae bacterium]|nr:hemerythrin domain-containing protein [Cyclobacteriaceae bacterium]
MLDLKKINDQDPLKRMVEKESGLEEYSPMDPPDAYAPPTVDAIPYEDMHLCLQKFIDEHTQAKKELEVFEKSLVTFKQSGWQRDKDIEKKFSSFFAYMDDQMVKHHLKEEKVLFPLLQKKLIEHEEHSKGKFPKTAIDMLEDDHLKIMQHLTLMFNFISLATRLPDMPSRALTFDVAAEQGFALIELFKLHIFREENVVFSKASKYISAAEFNEMLKQTEAYAQY